MEAINPVRVILFWDFEIARSLFYWNNSKKLDIANEPNYFTCRTGKKILKYQDMDPNLWNVRMTMRVPSYYESSQWFSNARYDYSHSGAFLDMGSGSPIDDLVESGTIRLLDWNDSMTDVQLVMRFVEKVQAVSAVCKYSITVGREYRVLKSKIDTWTARCYHHNDDNYCSW
ncbi:hypothetical protein M9H77_17423 [Catharanthus roseus]|uniref:Uncharacterized protein n=1 Tax=Catharanthus roseus TaxID=4058 RepID=A0ACC0B4I5_CATRO|nr:hypothetical protein M9H77_17423 [Catharanthus roseus]